MHAVVVVKLDVAGCQEDCAPCVEGDTVLITSTHYDEPGVLRTHMEGLTYNRRRLGFRYPGELVVAADLGNKSTEAEMHEQSTANGRREGL